MKATLIFIVIVLAVVQTFAKCPEPKCETDQDKRTLQLHDNAKYYWKCTQDSHGVWKPVEHQCPLIWTTCCAFSYKDQDCVIYSTEIETCPAD